MIFSDQHTRGYRVATFVAMDRAGSPIYCLTFDGDLCPEAAVFASRAEFEAALPKLRADVDPDEYHKLDIVEVQLCVCEAIEEAVRGWDCLADCTEGLEPAVPGVDY